MIEYSILLIILVLSFLGHGTFMSNLILANNKSRSLSDLILVSFFSLSFIVTFIHFFLPISYKVNIIIHTIGILLFFFYFNNLKKFFNKKNLSVFFILSVLSILFFYEHKPNEDFGFYHLPYIVNFTSEKVIFGLNSLHISQGYNSMWLNLNSLFYFFKNEFKHLYLLNSIFFISIIFIFITEIINNFDKKNTENKLLFLFSFVFLFFFIVKFSRINSYGIDVPGNFFLIISILYFLKLTNSSENSLLFFQLFVISLSLAITIRIMNLPFLILLFYSLFIIKVNKKILLSRFTILIFFFGIFYLIQQFIYTGCILVPSKISCFIKPTWFDPDYLNIIKSILFVNHSYGVYEGPLDIKEYHENFNWVPNWFNRNSIELVEFITAFLLPILLLKIFSKKNNFIINEKNKIYEYSLIILSLLICASLWFYNSPVIRMGNHFIMLLIFFLLIVFNFFKVFPDPINNKKTYVFIFTFSLIFFVNKNISRINNIEFEKNIWPNFKKINFKSEIKNNLNLNQVIPGLGPQTSVCWDVPFICRNSFDDIDIHKSKSGYVFIYKFKN